MTGHNKYCYRVNGCADGYSSTGTGEGAEYMDKKCYKVLPAKDYVRLTTTFYDRRGMTFNTVLSITDAVCHIEEGNYVTEQFTVIFKVGNTYYRSVVPCYLAGGWNKEVIIFSQPSISTKTEISVVAACLGDCYTGGGCSASDCTVDDFLRLGYGVDGGTSTDGRGNRANIYIQQTNDKHVNKNEQPPACLYYQQTMPDGYTPTTPCEYKTGFPWD